MPATCAHAPRSLFWLATKRRRWSRHCTFQYTGTTTKSCECLLYDPFAYSIFFFFCYFYGTYFLLIPAYLLWLRRLEPRSKRVPFNIRSPTSFSRRIYGHFLEGYLATTLAPLYEIIPAAVYLCIVFVLVSNCFLEGYFSVWFLFSTLHFFLVFVFGILVFIWESFFSCCKNKMGDSGRPKWKPAWGCACVCCGVGTRWGNKRREKESCWLSRRNETRDWILVSGPACEYPPLRWTCYISYIIMKF